MKVYEIMKELSKVPAGAEVRFSCLTTVEEIVKASPQEDEGKIFYEVNKAINDIDAASESVVFIYS